jgi:hypothetical protein
MPVEIDESRRHVDFIVAILVSQLAKIALPEIPPIAYQLLLLSRKVDACVSGAFVLF